MTTASEASPAKDVSRVSITAKSGHLSDTSFRVLSLGAGFSVLAVLVGILVSTVDRSREAFAHQGLSFFTSTRWAPNADSYGSLSLIYGTMVGSAIGLLMAVPCSIGIALFLTEIAKPYVKKPVVFLMDILAAVPSVVFGLWGVAVLQGSAPTFYEGIGNVLGRIPLLGGWFQGPYSGKSFATAGFILALMITPIITSITREVLETTPAGQKEAALALGATRWEMIRGAVLPHSAGGIVAAVLLGLGRAMGETIAVALVIGSSPAIVYRLFAPGDALPSVIANQWGEARTSLIQSGLIALGLVLFVMTILINLIARAVLAKAEKH